LARLLAEKRGVRNIQALPRLKIRLVLSWIDGHFQRTGHWPKAEDGPIPEAPGETWMAVAEALRVGVRGLVGGSSLAQLLGERRGVRNQKRLPHFAVEQLLLWADACHRRTGVWPKQTSGPIIDAPGETWLGVQMALAHGGRGLPGGSSLAQLLAERRGVRNEKRLPGYRPGQILDWVRAHHRRTGKWPNRSLGPIADAPGETWHAVDSALRNGGRRLPGGSSLALFLAARCSVRHLGRLPDYRPGRIVVWARAHRRRTGKWPNRKSGPVIDAPGETWSAVETALRNGRRGLPGGSSLPQLLADQCGVRNIHRLPRLQRKQLVAWSRAYRRHAGRWPTYRSGAIPEAPGETWQAVESALRLGSRGFPGGSSLHRFLQEALSTS
jgi:hypothetical protein